VIPGLREKARQLNSELGPLTRNEIKAALIVGACIVTMAMRPYVSFLQPIDKTAIILISTILFFITGIMDLDDLEAIPWNIILLFAGAMSIGNCLWQTGAANWMAVNWLVMFQQAHWFVFVMSIAFFVMMMTNFIMNVAAIAISLPVALVIAPYLGVAGEVILFAALVTAGMPFLLLVGAAPNAIAYDSGQFTTGEFFLYGIPASIILILVTGFAVFFLWPLMGMPVTLGP
jgi:sodium-dependent dicarboxylate transporter 2/3/5